MLRRRVLALLARCLCIMVACQPAPHASASEAQPPQLRDRGVAGAPPVSRAPTYPVSPAELLQNGSFADGVNGWSSPHAPPVAVPKEGGAAMSMRVTSSTLQSLPPHAIEAGKSYRLALVARAEQGAGAVWVRFREASKHQVSRSFGQDVTDASTRSYTLTFDAPAFTDLAEVQVEAKQGALVVDSISLKMAPPIVHTESVASWVGSFVPEGYALVFNDEFNGTELDRKKWNTRYFYDSERLDRLQGENERYRDNQNHVVKDGILHLTARHLALSQPDGVNYESGMIRSAWTVKYGFFEARVKMPAGLGAWPAFWLLSDLSSSGRMGWPPELDFFEFADNGRDDKPNMIHLGLSEVPGHPNAYLYMSSDFHEKNKDFYAPYNFSEGWHTIAAEWTPDSVTNYVDGVKVVARTFQWAYKDGEPAGPAHVLLNLAIGGPWAGRYGIDDAAFPQSFDIDWVRVYQRVP